MEVGISLFENRKHAGYIEVIKGERKEKEKGKTESKKDRK